MSFQYINPYYIPQYQIPMNMGQSQQAYIQPQYAQNPYQASFYNQNMVFPYNNPNFMPKINNKGYIKTGEVLSPTGELTHLYELNNGHKIAIVQREDEETIVKTFVDAGSMNETDEKRGVQHVNEHGLFKGSSKLKDGDVFKLTGQMGAYTNASTDYAQINYYIAAPYMGEEELKKTIEIQADMVYNPLFDHDAMESEKGPICEEISMINDEPQTNAYNSLIQNLFQIQSTSENLVAGSIDTVKKLSTEDMHNYHQTYYDPKNLHTVIVADKSIDLDNIIQYAADNFKITKERDKKIPIKKEVLRPIQASFRKDIRSSKTNKATALIGFAGPKPKDSKDFMIQEMLSYYMRRCSSSPLKKDLENIDGYFESSTQKVGLNESDPYAIVQVIETNPNDEQKGLDAFYDAVIDLQTKPLTDDDMTAIKNNIKKEIEYSMTDSESLCDVLGNSMRDNAMDFYTQTESLLNSVTKKDIMDYARKYYDLNKAGIVVLHPTSVSEEDIKNNYSSSKYSMHNVKKPQNISFSGIKNIKTDKVNEYQLSNNTHLVLNDTNSNFCAFNWNINIPPVKPKNPNIPLVLRYMFEKGSEYKQQDELERFKELNAIDMDVYVGKKGIEITGNCMPENIDKTLGLMNELLYHPKLTEKDFETGKKFVKSMLQASHKNAKSNILDRLYPGYFPTEKKMLSTIDDLRLSDIKEFYNTLLQNGSSSFIATVPKTKHPELVQNVISHQNMPNITFKELSPQLKPIFEPNAAPNVIYDTDDLNQAQICKTYKFPMSGNIEDEVKFELVNTILGGSSNARLFADLREKRNLAYSVSSNIQSFENTGILTMQIQTTTDNKSAGIQKFDNVEKSLEGFTEHSEKLCNEYVSDEELSSAKMKLKQRLTGECQNPISENSLLAMNALEPYGIKRIDKYSEAIDKITKEDIKEASQFIFSHNPTISILASEDTINSQLDYLKTQGNLEPANIS